MNTQERLTPDQIMLRYHDGSLAEEDDATLYRWVIILENLQRILFNISDNPYDSPSERAGLLKRCRQLNEVTQGIINLLLIRYGCND